MWRRSTKCDYKRDWLWVQSPLEEVKYLFKFMFPFHRSGIEAKGGELRHSKAIPPEFGGKFPTFGGKFSTDYHTLGSFCQREAVLMIYFNNYSNAFQSEKIEILNNSIPRMRNEPTTVVFTVTHLCHI